MLQQVPYKELKALGNVPVGIEVLQSLYKDYQSPNMHISMLEASALAPARLP